MKKFLAALLAVVMVVSLIPATVFAADAECALSSDDHSKANCLLAGVEFTKVSEEEGKCGQDGYTMYLCECGTYFADDIVDKPDHTHAVGAKPVSERVEPTCGDWGYAAVYTCDNCGEDYPEYKTASEKPAASDNAPANAIKKKAHTFDNEGSASYGTDCTKEKQTCLVCGTVAKNTNRYTSHAFNYADPHAIVTLPGVCTEGKAVFKCTRKDCVGTSSVAIQPTGHNTTDMKHYDEVPSVDCGTAGVKEHWACRECGDKYYYNEENEFVKATDEDLVIEAEHLNPVIIDEGYPYCGTDGWITYKCRACNSKSWTVEYKAATGHTTFKELMDHNELAAKDENDDILPWEYEEYDFGCDGYVYYWNCHNPLCGSEEQNVLFGYDADAICDEACEYIVPGTKGHDLVKVTVPFAYHEKYTADGAAANDKYVYAYTLLLCQDPACTLKAGKPTGWTWVTEDEEPDVDSEYFYLNVSVIVESDGNVYEMNEDELDKYTYVGVDNVRFAKISAQPINCARYKHFYENDTTNRNVEATCSRTGLDSYVCSNNECRDYSERTVAKLTHVPKYTGAECGSYILKCALCDGTIKAKNAWTHEIDRDAFIETIEVPNCKKAAGDYYGCLHCSGEVIENKKTYSYTTKYNSYEEARLAHEQGTLTLLDSREGNCYTVGKDEYKCSACSKYFWVYDVEYTGKHIPDFSKVITEEELITLYNGEIPAGAIVYYEEANCLHGAGYTSFNCDRCGEPVEGAKPLDHNFDHEDGYVAKKSATCTTTGNKAYYQCNNECCYTLSVGADGEVVKTYVKYEKKTRNTYPNGLLVVETYYVEYAGNSWFEGLKAHNSALTHTVAASCTTAGFERYYCTICKVQEVKNVVAPTGHVKGQIQEAAPDCDTEGYVYYKCDGTNCTGDDGIACICDDPANCTCKFGKDDGVYTDEETAYVTIPALGHINKSGRPIVDSCMDTETDRVCVREGCEYDGDPSTKKVPKSHKDSAPRHFNATCTTPEYNLTVCENGCGQKNKVEHLGDALGHKFAWGVEAGLEYVDAKVLAEKTKEFFADPANKVSAYTAATYNENGSITFECARCNEKTTMDVKIVGVGITFVVDNAVVAGANNVIENGELVRIMPVDGDVLAINIDIRAFETDVWGFNFDFAYDAKALDFLGYNYLLGDAFATFSVNNVVTDEVVYEDINNDGYKEVAKTIKAANGVVKFAAYNEYSMEGKLNSTKISGINNVVTLYFQVTAAYEVEDRGVITTEFANRLKLSVSNIAVADTEKEIESYGDAETLIITSLMDTNATGNAQVDKFNVIDLQNCIKIIKGQAEYEYKAAADVNKDGVVNLTDLDLMNEYLVGAIDADYIYNALNWTAPEGFVAG